MRKLQLQKKLKDYGMRQYRYLANKTRADGILIVGEPNGDNNGRPTYNVYDTNGDMVVYIGQYQMTRGRPYASDRDLYEKIHGKNK